MKNENAIEAFYAESARPCGERQGLGIQSGLRKTA